MSSSSGSVTSTSAPATCLDDLVGQARRIVSGVQPQELRDNQPLRQQIATQLSGVQSVLDGMLVDRPRRNILRRSRQGE